jgi:predicted transcriptional regulator YdeE
MLVLTGCASPSTQTAPSSSRQETTMRSTTQNVEGFTVVGISHRESNDRPEDIGKLWQEFFSKGGPKQIPRRKNDEIYAVYTEYEGDHTMPFTMLIGCAVSSVDALPDGLVVKTISGARYAVFDASGPQPASVIAAWKHIWSSPLNRAYTNDFDHYRGSENVEVHVAVR